MGLLTVLLFFVYCYGLGFSVTRFLRNSDNALERHLMRTGIGLGTFPFLAVLMNALRVPLDWKIFFIVSLVIPAYSLIKNKGYKILKMPTLKITKTNINIFVVLAIFFFTLFMYEKGAFAYPYFEDEDPWGHASDAKYMSVAKTAFEPIEGEDLLPYAVPKPPSYDILMAVLHQTSPSLMWTVKFFNSLIISLGIIFFYFFAKEFMANKNKALFATFVLAAIPSYLSHFIWSHALIVTLFFPAFYAAEMIKYDKKWSYALAILIAGILLIQPTQAIKFVVLLGIYYGVKSVYDKKLTRAIPTAFALGLVLSLVWWAPNAAEMFKQQGEGAEFYHGKVSSNAFGRLLNAFPPESGSGTRPYTAKDFFCSTLAPGVCTPGNYNEARNAINNPVGLGLFIGFLIIISLVAMGLRLKSLKIKENAWISISLLWLLFTFLGINSLTFNLPVGLFAFRFWMLFAVAASLLLPAGMWFIAGLAKPIPFGKIAIFSLVIVGIIFTAAYPKYLVNTSPNWYAGQWGPGELEGYVWMKTLPVNAKVFTFADSMRIVGVDKYNCFWCKDEMEFRKQAFNKSADEIHLFIKSRGYEYAVISATDIDKYGLNKTNEKLQEFMQSDNFFLVYPPDKQITGIAVFRVT
jgi:hypothetical protein